MMSQRKITDIIATSQHQTQLNKEIELMEMETGKKGKDAYSS